MGLFYGGHAQLLLCQVGTEEARIAVTSGVGVGEGGWGLKSPHRSRETVSESSRANGLSQYSVRIFPCLLPRLLPGAAAPRPKLNPGRTLGAGGDGGGGLGEGQDGGGLVGLRVNPGH
jgi:hypothetical protein